jgi:hypothetical protein
MMQVVQADWSEAEHDIAQTAIQNAYEREIASLVELVRSSAGEIDAIDDIWRLHDFLSAKRHEVDGKYDFRSSARTFVLAQLVKDGLVTLDELSGIEPSKLSKVAALSRM